MSGLVGHVLSPTTSGLRWDRDGGLVWDAEGTILDGVGADRTVADCLLIPGLVDAHIHLPQLRVRGLFHEALLPWLKDHIWPEEERFAEFDYRQSVTDEFREGLLDRGTTAAGVYGSPTADSVHAVLRDLAPLTVRGGDVLMDQNSPDALVRTTEQAVADVAAAAGEYGERYAVTPRFAPTCTHELMERAEAIARAHGSWIQTHLAENVDECAWVAELFPEARSYTDVYARAGVLGPRTLMGHCIHLDDADLASLAATGTWAIHCPSSNIALGSGRMPLERLRAAGVRVALATDVGAGPQLSMLDALRCALEVHAGHAEFAPAEALNLATACGADALGEPRRGRLQPGAIADVVALRIPGGLRRGEDGQGALLRILAEFEGRYADAVAGVWLAGQRIR